MDKPSKFNERLTLIANIAVVLGIVFLALELRQNTQAIQTQTRDSLTEKQMTLSAWLIGTPEMTETLSKVMAAGGVDGLSDEDQIRWAVFAVGNFREWENSYYQYRRGLYSREDFESRRVRWIDALSTPWWRSVWESSKQEFAPDFRAEIDAIVAEIEN